MITMITKITITEKKGSGSNNDNNKPHSSDYQDRNNKYLETLILK